MKRILISITLYFLITSTTYAQLNQYAKDHAILIDVSGSMDEDLKFDKVKALIKEYIINEPLLTQGDRVAINTFCEIAKTDRTESISLFCGNYKSLISLRALVDEKVDVTGNDTNLIDAVKDIGIGLIKRIANITPSTTSAPRLKIIWIFTDNRQHTEEEEPVNTKEFYRHLDGIKDYRKVYFFPIIPEGVRYGFLLYSILISTDLPSNDEIKCFDDFIASIRNTNDLSFQPVLFKPIGEDVLKIVPKRQPSVKFKPDRKIEKDIEFALKSQFNGWIVKEAKAEMEILKIDAPVFFKLPEKNEIKMKLVPDSIPPLEHQYKNGFEPAQEISGYKVKITIPWVKSRYSFFDSFTQDSGRVEAKMALKVREAELVPVCMSEIHESEKMVRPIGTNTQLGMMKVDFIIKYPFVYFVGSILIAGFSLLLPLGLVVLLLFLLRKQLPCLLTTPEKESSFSLSPLSGYTVNCTNRHLGKIKVDILGCIKFFAGKGVTIGGKAKAKKLRKEGNDFELNIGEEIIHIYFEVQHKLDKITAIDSEDIY